MLLSIFSGFFTRLFKSYQLEHQKRYIKAYLGSPLFSPYILPEKAATIYKTAIFF